MVGELADGNGSDTRIQERMAAITDLKERAAARVEEAAAVLADVAKDVEVARDDLVIKFQREPQPILDKEGRVIGLDVLVRVYVGGIEQQVDPHRVVINPPMLVPDGTFRQETDERGNKVQRPNFREDPREAFLQVVEQSIRDTPNPAEWVK